LFLNRIKEKRVFLHSIKVQNDEMIGHLLHHDSLTKSVIYKATLEDKDRGVYETNQDRHG